MKVKISIALMLALTPSLAFARPKTATSHMRPQLFRDRAPRVRSRDLRVHEAKLPSPRVPPPPAAKEEF